MQIEQFDTGLKGQKNIKKLVINEMFRNRDNVVGFNPAVQLSLQLIFGMKQPMHFPRGLGTGLPASSASRVSRRSCCVIIFRGFPKSS